MAGIRRKKVKVKKIPEGPKDPKLSATFRSPGKAGKIVKKSGCAVKRKTGGKVKVKKIPEGPRRKDLGATFRSLGKAGKRIRKSGGAVKRKAGGKVKRMGGGMTRRKKY